MTQIDKITLKAKGLDKVSEIEASINAELMYNYQKKLPVHASSQIELAEDDAGNPMVFSIDANKQMMVYVPDNSDSSGFKPYSISKNIPNCTQANMFDVKQGEDGSICLALSIGISTGEKSTLLLWHNLSNKKGETDWANLNDQAKDVALSGLEVEKINLGIPSPLLDADRAIITGKRGDDDFIYSISDDALVELDLPENVSATHVLDVKPGFIGRLAAYYILYNLHDTTLLVASYKQRSGSTGYSKMDILSGESPSRFTSFDLFHNKHGESSSAVLGSNMGLYVLGDINQSTSLLKLDMDFGDFTTADGEFDLASMQIRDVSQVIAKQDGENISVWTLDGASNVHYVTAKRVGDEIDWYDPIVFDDSTLHIAPLRSYNRKANEVFIVGQDLSIVHHWQDPQSTMWHSKDVKKLDDGEYIKVHSFTTHINLGDQDGNPLTKQNVFVTCSERMYVSLNGLAYHVEPTDKAKVELDFRGNLTIIVPASEISCPTFHIQSDHFSETINVYPNAGVSLGLDKVKKGGDLGGSIEMEYDPKNPEKTSEPLVSSEYNDSSSLDTIASNLDSIHGAKKAPRVGTFTAGNVFASVSHAGPEPQAQKGIQASELFTVPNGKFLSGMVLSDGNWQVQQASPMLENVQMLFSLKKTFKHLAGDAWHGIKHLAKKGFKAIKKGVSLAVKTLETGLSIVIDFAGQTVFSLVVDSLLTAFKAINFVLSAIGIDLTKILAWLGKLFGWDKILKAQKAAEKLLDGSLEMMLELCKNSRLKNLTLAQIDSVENSIKSLFTPENQQTVTSSSKQKGQKDNPFNSSPANWIFSHLGKLTSANPGLDNGFPDLTQELMGILEKTVEKEIQDLEKLLSDFLDFVEGKNKNPLTTFGDDIVNLVFDPMKTIVGGVLDLMPSIITAVKSAMDKKLEIPFFSELYKLITLGDNLTFKSAFALILAIPSTLVSKAVGIDNPVRSAKLPATNELNLDELVSAAGPLPMMRFAQMKAIDEQPDSGEKAAAGLGIVGNLSSFIGTALAEIDSTGKFNLLHLLNNLMSSGTSIGAIAISSGPPLRYGMVSAKIASDLCAFFCAKKPEVVAVVNGARNVLNIVLPIWMLVKHKSHSIPQFVEDMIINAGGLVRSGGKLTNSPQAELIGFGLIEAGYCISMETDFTTLTK